MRPWYIAINGVLIFLGYLAFKATDLDSPDPFYSVTLVLVDMVYCMYLLLLLFIEIYNRTWR
ncbi:MAG: hypothetical protein CMN28_09575 [Salinisphaeraceae bacterium]|jgi:uncharacterized membrane protein|nr:hypothetical protein [Salinisphaeraceae bacterium]